jgi:hypothetical protein
MAALWVGFVRSGEEATRHLWNSWACRCSCFPSGLLGPVWAPSQTHPPDRGQCRLSPGTPLWPAPAGIAAILAAVYHHKSPCIFSGLILYVGAALPGSDCCAAGPVCSHGFGCKCKAFRKTKGTERLHVGNQWKSADCFAHVQVLTTPCDFLCWTVN